MESKVRMDKYLWCIRLFKTRRLATDACGKGHIKLNGKSVKASKQVFVGEQFEVNTGDRKWVIKVVGLIDKRVGYPEAIKQYIDQTPEDINVPEKSIPSSFYTGKRLSKIGRPTKRERRDLDNYMD